MTFSPGDFASSFKDFMDTMNSQQVSEDPPFFKRIKMHFGQNPTELPIVSDEFPRYEHPNVHLALESYRIAPGRDSVILGFLDQFGEFKPPNLSSLVSPSKKGLMGQMETTEGPVQYKNIHLDQNKALACIQLGLYLITDQDSKKLAVLMRSGDLHFMRGGIILEVMAERREEAEAFLATIRKAIESKNIYRGHVLSIEQGDSMREEIKVKFHALPQIERNDIILPEGLISKIERQTIRFGELSDALLSANRHLKRGLLLYGPPGTGKTLTAMYLSSQMKNRTVLLLVGRSLALLEKTCALARTLQPSMVVLEDVDLIAEERTRQQCSTPVLFELLNEMDGLSKDLDVIFLLTTNRADILEPALASRPGRIDQAFEIPLPNPECRKRLFDLYSQGLNLQLEDEKTFIKRTEGASGAFIRELMRKAALFAADDAVPIVVKDTHVDQALRELVVSGEITKSLLGFRTSKRK